jgi:hypothetical protein
MLILMSLPPLLKASFRRRRAIVKKEWPKSTPSLGFESLDGCLVLEAVVLLNSTWVTIVSQRQKNPGQWAAAPPRLSEQWSSLNGRMPSIKQTPWSGGCLREKWCGLHNEATNLGRWKDLGWAGSSYCALRSVIFQQCTWWCCLLHTSRCNFQRSVISRTHAYFYLRQFKHYISFELFMHSKYQHSFGISSPP